jgi:hypothetical protein
LGALERELGRWSDAKRHDQELVDLIRVAIVLLKCERSNEKGDFEGVVEGMRKLTRDDLADMFDPGLVEMSLEVCVDAIFAATRSGAEPILRETLQPCQKQLVNRLYRIEVRGGARTGPAR